MMGKKNVETVETVEEVVVPTVEDVVAAVAVPAEDVPLEGNLGVVSGLTPAQCAIVLGLPEGTLVTSAQEQEAIRLLSSDPAVVSARLEAERAYKLQSFGV